MLFLGRPETLWHQLITEMEEKRSSHIKKSFPTPSTRNRHTYLRSHFPSIHFSQHTEQSFYCTITEGNKHSVLLIPHCYCVISVFWTYTNSPEPIKSGEVREFGGIQPHRSERDWTVWKWISHISSYKYPYAAKC